MSTEPETQAGPPAWWADAEEDHIRAQHDATQPRRSWATVVLVALLLVLALVLAALGVR